MMRLWGSLLVWISLGGATLSAVTAYRPRLEQVAGGDEVLTLRSVAGRAPQTRQQPDAAVKPLFESTSERPVRLTDDVLQELAAAGVQRISVKEFAWARWSERWWFVVSLGGLIAGGLCVQLASRRSATQSAATGRAPEATPTQLLDAAVQRLQTLVEARNATEVVPDQWRDQVITGLERVAHDQLESFLAAQSELRREVGLTRYAQLMDRFAQGERVLNRAWSAAVDGYEEEAEICLAEGYARIRAAADFLRP